LALSIGNQLSLDGIQQDDHPIGGREADHFFGALKIGRVRRREITDGGKRLDTIQGRSIFIETIRKITEQIYPQCINAISLTVGLYFSASAGDRLAIRV
jgi:hypothetical protein